MKRFTSADHARTLAGYDEEEARMDAFLLQLEAQGRQREIKRFAHLFARSRQAIALRRPWIQALLAQSLDDEAQNGGPNAHE